MMPMRSFLPLLVLLTGCGQAEREGDEPRECGDDADQDGDGLFDCADPDCAGAAHCSGDDSGTDTDSGADTDSGTDSDTDSGTDSGTDTGPDTGSVPCRARVTDTRPAAGERSAYYRGDIEFELSGPDPSATVSGPVSGVTTFSADGTTVTFTPDAPLDPVTDYTFVMTTCVGSFDLSFTTSQLGMPVTDVRSLARRTYGFALSEGRVVRPEGVGSVLSAYMDQETLLGVRRADETNLDVRFAPSLYGSAPPEQDTCAVTGDVSGVDFSEQPWFSAGALSIVLNIAGVPVPLDGMTFEGAFASDGSYIGGGVVSGTLDTRPLDPLLDDSGTPGAFCAVAASFGETCEPCPEDGASYCLPLRVDELTATEVDAMLVERTAADVAADPSCR